MRLGADGRPLRRRVLLLNTASIRYRCGIEVLRQTDGWYKGVKAVWLPRSDGTLHDILWATFDQDEPIPDWVHRVPLFTMASAVLTKASGSPWTVDATFNTTSNTIYCIGAGGSVTSGISTGGGGGGACVFVANYNHSWTPGTSTATFQVTAGNTATTQGTSANNTTFDSSAFIANCGGGTSSTTAGTAGLGTGSTVPAGGTKNAGGAGGAGVASGASRAGGGGGGAGGPNGAGVTGSAGSGNVGGQGGQGDSTFGGLGGASGSGGIGGTEFDASHGSGGGGGGNVGGTNGTLGGLYGGGAGGAGNASSGAILAGGDGLIFIVWTVTGGNILQGAMVM